MQTRFFVRRARAGDLPRILEIERQGFGRWAWDRNLFAEYTRTCGDLFLVAGEGPALLGYSIGRLGRNGGSVESIAVAKEARGSGVADALLKSLLRRFRRRGAERVALMVKETNRRAIAFYERHGFKRVRRVPAYYEDGRAGILYQAPGGESRRVGIPR
jgi:[ribosomal protein S18]-alanine N-acetyltransferase